MSECINLILCHYIDIFKNIVYREFGTIEHNQCIVVGSCCICCICTRIILLARTMSSRYEGLIPNTSGQKLMDKMYTFSLI